VGEDMMDDEGSEASDIRAPVLAHKSHMP
jgi:hypothetical protein